MIAAVAGEVDTTTTARVDITATIRTIGADIMIIAEADITTAIEGEGDIKEEEVEVEELLCVAITRQGIVDTAIGADTNM